MATDSSFIDYVFEQAALGERMTCKRMFGEYALYIDGKVVAFACDDSLLVKDTQATSALTAALPRRAPYPGAKLYPVADDLLDDSERLRELLLATEQALPAAKPKKTATKPAKAGAKAAVHPVTAKAGQTPGKTRRKSTPVATKVSVAKAPKTSAKTSPGKTAAKRPAVKAAAKPAASGAKAAAKPGKKAKG